MTLNELAARSGFQLDYNFKDKVIVALIHNVVAFKTEMNEEPKMMAFIEGYNLCRRE